MKSVNQEYNLGEGSLRKWIREYSGECEINPELNNEKDLMAENLKLPKQLAEAKKENDCFKKSRRILRKGTRLETFQFIEIYNKEFGVQWLLNKFSIKPNAYYNYKRHRKSHYYGNKTTIEEIYHEYASRPGYRMMKIFLSIKHINLSNPTVYKYMKELGLRSIVVRKKPRYKKGDCYKKFDNLVKQNFSVDAPNKVWCTDFTYMWLEDGAKRYNCTIIDLFDRSPVATLNSNRINAKLAIKNLKAALRHNTLKDGLILHSDQGTQFASRDFTEFCSLQNITQSMSKAGCPYDNAPMESFYGTFKADFANHHSFESDEALNEATYDYIFVYYNHIRPHSANGYLTPFEKRFS